MARKVIPKNKILLRIVRVICIQLDASSKNQSMLNFCLMKGLSTQIRLNIPHPIYQSPQNRLQSTIAMLLLKTLTKGAQKLSHPTH